MGGYCRGIDAHATKFRHTKKAIVFSDTITPVQRGTRGTQSYRQPNDQTRHSYQYSQHESGREIKKAFHPCRFHRWSTTRCDAKLLMECISASARSPVC